AEILRAQRERTHGTRLGSTPPETHGRRRRETPGHCTERVVRFALIGLVRLFPAAFREQFGGGMIEQIQSDYDRARARGFLSALWFACATAADLMQSALAEHWNPTWTNMSITNTRGAGMRRRLSEWSSDLRHASRALGRSPGFTIVTAG